MFQKCQIIRTKRIASKQLNGNKAQTNATWRQDKVNPRLNTMKIPKLYDITAIVDITPRTLGSLISLTYLKCAQMKRKARMNYSWMTMIKAIKKILKKFTLLMELLSNPCKIRLLKSLCKPMEMNVINQASPMQLWVEWWPS